MIAVAAIEAVFGRAVAVQITTAFAGQRVPSPAELQRQERDRQIREALNAGATYASVSRRFGLTVRQCITIASRTDL